MRNEIVVMFVNSITLMKYLNILFVAFVFICASCSKAKVNSDKSFPFFDSLTTALKFNKTEQQLFINALTDALVKLKNDENADIDVSGLEAMLEKIRPENIKREKNIEAITEFDNDIHFKAKALDYVNTFNRAYEIEIPTIIAILKEKSGNRFTRVQQILMPILSTMKQKEILLTTAEEDFRNRYESKGYWRTGNDYEYMSLKNYKYETTEIFDGTQIKLISYSGGKDLNDGKVYYSQFIGIHTVTGDTVRILALSALQQFDPEKSGTSSGIYKADISVRPQMIANDNEFIIFNKNNSLEKQNYKTTFGLLNFN